MFTRSDALVILGFASLATLLIGVDLLLSWPSSLAEPDSEGFKSHRIVDLNRASLAELRELPGIGPVLAERITRYRLLHGPFRSIEELLCVPGIGLQTLERLRPYLRICRSTPCE